MIGIDISDRSIKLVEAAGKGNPVVRTICWSPLQKNLMRRGMVQDVAGVTAALKEAMMKCSPVPVASGDVVASIPEVQSFVRVLDLPQMKDYEIEEAVQWAVRRHIPFDLDSVYLDWEPLWVSQEENKRRQVLVGAAQRDVVDPLLGALDGLDLNVVALELETQAILRCLLPLDPQEAKEIRGVLAIDLGATLTNVVFFDQGAIRFTTSIQWGGDDLTQRLAHDLRIAPTAAVEKKAKIGVVEGTQDKETAAVLRAAVLDLVHRVERVVQEMTVQLKSEQRVRVVLLSGGGADLAGVVDLFSSVFTGVPVQLGNPWTNLYKEENENKGVHLSASDAMHFTTAIGLALRPKDYI